MLKLLEASNKVREAKSIAHFINEGILIKLISEYQQNVIEVTNYYGINGINYDPDYVHVYRKMRKNHIESIRKEFGKLFEELYE